MPGGSSGRASFWFETGRSIGPGRETQLMNEMNRISVQPPYDDAVRAVFQRKPQLFIGGEWVDSSEDRLIPVFDPSTGREIAHIVDASDADVDRAVAAARTAFDDGRWSGIASFKRERMLMKLADLLEASSAELAELESVDNGKPRSASAGLDLPSSVRMLRYMAGWATKLSGEHVEPSNAPAGMFHA